MAKPPAWRSDRGHRRWKRVTTIMSRTVHVMFEALYTFNTYTATRAILVLLQVQPTSGFARFPNPLHKPKCPLSNHSTSPSAQGFSTPHAPPCITHINAALSPTFLPFRTIFFPLRTPLHRVPNHRPHIPQLEVNLKCVSTPITQHTRETSRPYAADASSLRRIRILFLGGLAYLGKVRRHLAQCETATSNRGWGDYAALRTFCWGVV